MILKDSINKDDMPDGIYYRKNPVYITNGLEIVHNGVISEENIHKYMNEFINLYNSKLDIYIKMILCHFIFEYIHPFYDGNGRLGRYLFSNGLLHDTDSYLSFNISSAFLLEKKQYYQAFNLAYDKYEFGSLNSYVTKICSILLSYIDTLIKELKDKIKILKYNHNLKLTKSEEKIYKFIYEASLFSIYGVSNDEIITKLNISKRTLIYSLNKFKNYDLLIDTKIGRFTYHKINIDKI